MNEQHLGAIISGSLSKGLELKLDPSVPLESLRAGMFAIAAGEKYDFFSMVTDLELRATTTEALEGPPPDAGSLLREVLTGDSIYAGANLRPHLMVDPSEPDDSKALLPVKTIPGHFTEVRKASPEDVERVFGREEGSPHHFHIGTPLEMDEIPVCLDLKAFSERSNGIFGKSGTGKTFLTRIVLAGMIHRSPAVNLIFDMHGEYGWQGTDEGSASGRTAALQQLFGRERVQVFTLDPRPSKKYDHELRIPYDFLEPEDVLSLQKVIGLSPTAAENAYLLQKRHGRNWFSASLEMDSKETAEGEQAHQGALEALRRKLIRLQRECEGFLKPTVVTDAIPLILKNLENGVHTVIDFGRYSQLTHYLLVANLLTRRIDEKWREMTEEHLADSDRHAKPRPLVITIEEAHKFLEPGIAEHTIFGRIARELRKYSVTLLIVDQRPSQIEREVLSQLGTKICCLLDDPADVDAVMAGTSATGGLKSVLASLDSRQQALIFGHALPMPVVVKTRNYDDHFKSSVGYRSEAKRDQQARVDRDLLWE
jgi:DNA helicase HerA-like ATPase